MIIFFNATNQKMQKESLCITGKTMAMQGWFQWQTCSFHALNYKAHFKSTKVAQSWCEHIITETSPFILGLLGKGAVTYFKCFLYLNKKNMNAAFLSTLNS